MYIVSILTNIIDTAIKKKTFKKNNIFFQSFIRVPSQQKKFWIL